MLSLRNVNKRFFFTTYLVLLSFFSCSAQDTSRIQISIITCEPGSELYSIFGHTAIRVIDSNAVADVIYNYGTFDFGDPNFYEKFVRGKLKYFLSIERSDDFFGDYQMDNRGITEQVLTLTADEKMNIKHALANNIREENRFYLYDFFLDNCTTRIRDLIQKYRKPVLNLPAPMPTDLSFRNAIHQCLDRGKMYWSKLGIDILLGSPTDATMTEPQQLFLPDNFMASLDSNRSGAVVLNKRKIFESVKVEENTFRFTPLICSLILLAVGFLLSFMKSGVNKQSATVVWFDNVFFLLLGLLGVLLLFMWVGTDHTMTKANYNLLWAIPVHVMGAFLVRSKTEFAKNYFLVTTVASVLLLLSWFLLPQKLNTALIPIVILNALRAGSLYFHKRKILAREQQEN